MKNCLIVDGGSVTGLRTSEVTYMFSEPIAQEVLKRGGKAFITAFEENPIKALQDINVKIEGLPLTTNKSKSEFTGYKGGYSDKGKGSPEGDGKDKAMREVANGGFIGEIKNLNNETSSKTSFLNVKINDINPAYIRVFDGDNGNLTGGMFGDGLDLKRDKNGNVELDNNNLPIVIDSPRKANDVSVDRVVIPKQNNTYKVMLARNGEFKNQILYSRTKDSIKEAANKGATFVVGDMPGVDTQFIEYLIEIGAKFEVYHTDNKAYWTSKNQPENIGKSRIDVESMMNNQQVQNTDVKTANDIYNQLGNKTQSENVKIKPWAELKDATKAIVPEGIISTRIKNSNEHFGNPFSSNVDGLIKTESTKESVEKYIDWIINSKDNRAKWIREQLKSGSLKNRPVIYYKELGEPSHATALDYLINKHNWNDNQPLFSKFDTETNPTQDFKDLIQSLSDKLGIPVRYDNNLPYAGAFIDGNVVLNPSKMDETTVWHEFAHPFVQAVRKQNKPLYDNLVNEIYNTPHGKALLADVQKLYSDKSKKIQEEEVIVELIARYASGKIDGFTAKKYKSIWDKVKDFIRSIGKMMFNYGASDVAKTMSPILTDSTTTHNILTMNNNMTIKDLSSIMKNGGVILLSNQDVMDENMLEIHRAILKDGVEEIKKLNLRLEKLTQSKKELIDQLSNLNFNTVDISVFNDIELENLIERLRSIKDYNDDFLIGNEKINLKNVDVNKITRILNFIREDIHNIEIVEGYKRSYDIDRITIEKIKNKPFENKNTVKNLNGVFHNIGAYMNNADITSVKDAISNFTSLLKKGNKLELATWDGTGDKFTDGEIKLSFAKSAPVKMSYVKDAHTYLKNTYEGKERVSDMVFDYNIDRNNRKQGYTESIFVAKKDNIETIYIISENELKAGKYMQELIRLSNLTGAPIIIEATNETIYTPENKVEYQPEIYESRFGNKDINKQTPEAIYKEVEEVFIQMRLDDPSQHTFEKIQSFEEFVGSIFENTNDASKFNVAKMLIKTPNYSNYLLNKSKFQIELMKRNLMYETDTNKIDVFNAMIDVLESKTSIFEIVNNTSNIELMSTIKDDIERAHKRDEGAFVIGAASLLFPLINETVFEGAFPYITTLGIANAALVGVTFAAGPIVSTFTYVKNAISNFFTNRRNKIVKGLENKFAVESLMKKKDIDLYIKILKNKMSKDGSNSEIEKLMSNLESIKSKLDLINSNMAVLTNNKYQSYMNDLLKAYGDKKYTHDNLVEAMIYKIENEEFVPKFIMNYAVQSGLTVENNSINRALFVERLLNFLEAYETENLRSTPADLNDLLGDYNINQILEPEKYKNQTKLANSMNKTKSDVIGKKKASKDLSTLNRSELEELIDSGDSLYVDMAKRMLYALNEKEALDGKSTHKKDSELNENKIKFNDKPSKLNDKPSKLSDIELDMKITRIEILTRSIESTKGFISSYKNLLEKKNDIIKRQKEYEDMFSRDNNRSKELEEESKIIKNTIQDWETRIKNESEEIKDLIVESLKSILSDYGTSYDSFSPQLKSQIKTKLTNNPELLNDSNFIKSLTC
jgi:hypothetical protein